MSNLTTYLQSNIVQVLTDLLRASPMEIEMLRMGLEATDNMQDEITNKDLIEAYEEAVENIKINGIQ